MTHRRQLALAVLALFACAYAKPPVAHVTGAAPFDLNGEPVKIEGVPSWPLYVGDLVASHNAPVTIVFKNGSKIVLEPNSKLRIEEKDKKIVATVLSGSGKFIAIGVAVALGAMAAVIVTDHPGSSSGSSDPYPTSTNPSAIK